ncbi:MAG TPA: glycoside hydrolase family 127 protein [Aggregatilinea sp.]|uniref:aceric acid hydrolase n=1 Tax=Aggregatilinea sp. TaxID=2806333 RepID=UPI002CD4F233|nr:glycoside hydrolase family 127 protein [Aggregatilinea sp.]HML20890.1 glycoside hydrolase family 127 protein [Aggregatilinea sp.]
MDSAVLASPYRELYGVPAAAVRLTHGFWAERFEVCRTVMVPHMWELLRDPDISHAYTNFLVAVGDEAGEHQGPKWHDGDFYKWLEAAAHIYSVTHDEALDRLMDEIIDVIRRSQREDGYIHTPVIIEERQGENAKAFRERLHFETYNMGHLMTTACVHYRATGKETLMDVARAAADYLYNFYKTATVELARNAICPSHYMGVVDMYRQTGEPRYLELARNLVEIRDLVTGGGDDNQDRLPFREQDHAVGHAVRANYLYAGVADIYMETGDPTLLSTLETLWKNVTSSKMYITGGCGALYDGASPDGAEDQNSITRVHQAYGREYQLPNVTAHNETCANLGNLFWNWRMFSITGAARFVDVAETVLYNSALVSISLDGKRYFYTNALRQIDGVPFELRWGRSREPYISCFCCPPNIVRTIAQVGSYLYSVSDEGIWANLYASSTASIALNDATEVHITQQTDYPWDGQISMTIDVPGETSFALMLRIPGWCAKATLSVNGVPVENDLPAGDYARVERVWSAGDKVELTLDMPVQFIESHPLVEETRNHLAVQRGPIVYCLESVDLPDDVSLAQVAISRTTTFTPDQDASFDGITDEMRVLRGTVQVIDSTPWNGQLYRPASRPGIRDIEAQLVPYYAWDNRGKSEMSVWLPELYGPERIS